MFDLSMLKGAAGRVGKGKPPALPQAKGKPEGGTVIEVAFGGASKGPQAKGGKVEALIAECAKKHGLSSEQLAADFAEFEAEKYGESPAEEAAEAPEDQAGEPEPEAA